MSSAATHPGPVAPDNGTGPSGHSDLLFERPRAESVTALDPMKEKLVRSRHDLFSIRIETIELSKRVHTTRPESEALATRLAQIIQDLLEGDSADITANTLLGNLEAVMLAGNEVIAFLRQQVRSNPVQHFLNRPKVQKAVKTLNAKLDGLVNAIRVSVLSAMYASQRRTITNMPEQEGLHDFDLRPPHMSAVALPPKPRIFFGRDKEVNAVVQNLLHHEEAHLAILGPGGMGKTTVAITVLHDKRVVENFPSYRIFVSCDGIDSAEGIVSLLANRLNVREHDDLRNALVRHLSALHAPILLILDNLESTWDTTQQSAVEELLIELANINRLSFVVTMRGTVRPAGVDWTLPVLSPLQPISIDAARQTFTSISQRKESEADVNKLLSLLDGLPLAITLMAYQGLILSAKDLLEAYRKEQTQLLRRGQSRRTNSLEISIEVSLKSLTMKEHPQALELLSILCLTPDGMDSASIVDALPSLELPREATRTLQQAALVDLQHQRLKVLSPIRDYVLVQYPPAGWPLAELRIHFINLTTHAYTPGTYLSRQTVDQLSREIANINSVLLHYWKKPPRRHQVEMLLVATQQIAQFSYLASQGDCFQLLKYAKARLEQIKHRQGAAECTHIMGDLLRMHHHYTEAMSTLEDAKAAFEAIDHQMGAAQCTWSMGDVLRMQRQYDQAVAKLMEANHTFLSIGVRSGSSQCKQTIGLVFVMLHQYEKGLLLLQEARTEFETIGDQLGAVQCKQSQGDVLQTLNRYEEAVANLEEVKATYEAIGNRLGVAHSIRRMGTVLHMLDRYDDALQKLEEAKKAFAIIGDQRGLAQCMKSMGEVLLTMNKYDDAIATLDAARPIFEAIGDRTGIAQCTQAMGDGLRLLSRYGDAIAKLKEAQVAFRAVRDPLGVAHCKCSIGDIQLKQSQFGDAMSNLEEAKVEFEAIDHRRDAARCAQSMGEVLLMLSRHEAAIASLEQAKSSFEAVGDAWGVALCTRNVGNVLRVMSRYEEAAQRLQEARGMCEAIGDRLGIAQCDQRIGEVLQMQMKHTEAMQALEQARAVFEAIGERSGVAQCIQSMSNILLVLGRQDETMPMLEKAEVEFGGIGDVLGAAQCTQMMGDVLYMLLRHDEALLKLEQAKVLFDNVGHRLGTAQCLQSMGNVLLGLHRHVDALAALSEARTVFENIDDKLGMAKCFLSVGNVLRVLDRSDEAIEQLEAAKGVGEVIGNRHVIAECNRLLGYTFLALDQPKKATSVLEEALNIYEEIGIVRQVEACRQILVLLRAEAPA